VRQVVHCGLLRSRYGVLHSCFGLFAAVRTGPIASQPPLFYGLGDAGLHVSAPQPREPGRVAEEPISAQMSDFVTGGPQGGNDGS
jgi:hypothetical protein